MTSNELKEARRLYDKFLQIADTGNTSFEDIHTIAKQSAIEAVDLMLYQSHVFSIRSPVIKESFLAYWKEIRDELVKMKG